MEEGVKAREAVGTPAEAYAHMMFAASLLQICSCAAMRDTVGSAASKILRDPYSTLAKAQRREATSLGPSPFPSSAASSSLTSPQPAELLPSKSTAAPSMNLNSSGDLCPIRA